MKKILVVLLVLSVATGVFAQEGEWSLNGAAQIGAVINFDPDPAADEAVKAISAPSNYNRLYDGFDFLLGSFGINYSLEGISAGTTIRTNTLGSGPTWLGNVNYGGENFNFAVESDLTALTSWSSPDFHQLWGNYSFLNGVVFIETSYVSGWKGDAFWASDTTGAFRSWDGRGDEVIAGPFVDKHTFTMIDGDWEGGPSSYIIGDIRLQGISFGLMIRDIFLKGKEYLVADNGAAGFTSVISRPDDYGDWSDDDKEAWDDDHVAGTSVAFVDDVLKKMIFGVKFEMSPIEVAAQFLMENYGVYVGGKWFVGPVTVGLSFMGILNEKKVDEINLVTLEKRYVSTDATKMKVGGGVNYDADGFGAVIKGFYALGGEVVEGVEGKISQIGVEPGFYYNVIPSHLQFKLDAGFYFFGYTVDGEKVTEGVNTVQYALQPQLFWNFLGTGAGGYGGTGIALRYRLVGGDAKKYTPIDLNNKFDVTFRYAF